MVYNKDILRKNVRIARQVRKDTLSGFPYSNGDKTGDKTLTGFPDKLPREGSPSGFPYMSTVWKKYNICGKDTIVIKRIPIHSYENRSHQGEEKKGFRGSSPGSLRVRRPTRRDRTRTRPPRPTQN